MESGCTLAPSLASRNQWNKGRVKHKVMGITGHNLTEGNENGKKNYWGSWGKGSSGLLGLGILEQYKCMPAHGAGLVLARKGEIPLDLCKGDVEPAAK